VFNTVCSLQLYINSLTLFFTSTGVLNNPVGLSKAPCFPDFSQAITYFLAFQNLRGGPLMLNIKRSLTRSTASLFRKLVWWRFIWLNPLSQAADKIGKSIRNLQIYQDVPPLSALSYTNYSSAQSQQPEIDFCFFRPAESAWPVEGTDALFISRF